MRATVTQLPPPDQQDNAPPDAWMQLRGIGLSYRQYDYWIRTGLIHMEQPEPGSGNRRSVAPDEVEIVRIMFGLISDGIAPRPARNIAESLHREGTATIGGYTIKHKLKKTT